MNMQTINKAIIGLGCSWTQGEGGYTEETWKKHKGKMNFPMDQSTDLIPMEWENSWVNVLARDHFTDYTPINLGQRGIGNRAAARCLYLTDLDWDSMQDCIIVFMLSGYERFDFFRQDMHFDEEPHFTRHREHPYKRAHHYNFNTVWPNDSDKFWKAYTIHCWSETCASMETLCSILEVQNFCKAYGFKFVLANAFDYRGKHDLTTKTGGLHEQIDWTKYIHDYRHYDQFVDLLVEADDWLQGEHERSQWWDRYHNLDYPKQFLTNDIHPNIDGYKLMAKELAEFITETYGLTTTKNPV